MLSWQLLTAALIWYINKRGGIGRVDDTV